MKDPVIIPESGKVKIDDVIQTLNEYIKGTIKVVNPLKIAENLHNGHYANRSNTSQLWTFKRFYELLNYNVGLIDVGKSFLSQKNYHGAFESFHSARYSQGLLDMTKSIVDEVKNGNRNNIGYARKALVDIVLLEGKEHPKKDLVKSYINTIADAYIAEYKSLIKNGHHKDNSYLKDALGLYRLNNNMLGIAKTSAKIAYHKMAHHSDDSSYANVGVHDNLHM